MKRRDAVGTLLVLIALMGMIVAPGLLRGATGALIEKLEIGLSGTGTVGYDGDGTLELGDAIDDAVLIQSGAGDPAIVAVDAGTQALTVSAIHSPAGKAGIVTLDHQSRTRWSLEYDQPIPEGAWTPVEFGFDQTFMSSHHFDEHAEATPGEVGVQAWSFSPTEAGYYQVNARIQFEQFERPEEPLKRDGRFEEMTQITTGPDGAVSIAILKNGVLHSLGNSLQVCVETEHGGYSDPHEHWVLLESNNAPNVADVVYLAPGDTIQIGAWWDGFGLLGSDVELHPSAYAENYVSVHKLS